MQSINSDDHHRCVDIFVRADGTFGFEEYRRDAEDRRGWFPIGGYATLNFASHDQALAGARSTIRWLAAP
jgi:hypothetical protein